MRYWWRRSTKACLLVLAWSVHAHEGWGVIVHERLGVVISDIPANTIWRIKDGRVDALRRGIHSHALIAGSDGAIYGTEPDVWRIDRDGRFSSVLPPTADLGLQSFLITRDGTIYSANPYDYRRPRVMLMRRAPDGAITAVATGFTAIDGMREEIDGAVLLVDGPSLRRVRANGVVSNVTPPLTRARFGEDLLGLSSIRGGVVHVADHASRRVLRVDLKRGDVRTIDRSAFFWAPAGVEVTDDGIYVLEHLRAPLAILGDLQLGPYLRVRRGPETLAVVWGRHTWIAGVIGAAIVILPGLLIRGTARRRRSRGAPPPAP